MTGLHEQILRAAVRYRLAAEEQTHRGGPISKKPDAALVEGGAEIQDRERRELFRLIDKMPRQEVYALSMRAAGKVGQ